MLPVFAGRCCSPLLAAALVRAAGGIRTARSPGMAVVGGGLIVAAALAGSARRVSQRAGRGSQRRREAGAVRARGFRFSTYSPRRRGGTLEWRSSRPCLANGRPPATFRPRFLGPSRAFFSRPAPVAVRGPDRARPRIVEPPLRTDLGGGGVLIVLFGRELSIDEPKPSGRLGGPASAGPLLLAGWWQPRSHHGVAVRSCCPLPRRAVP